MNTPSAEMQPFDLFVIKVASRCNLACGYCYEYFHGDESWRKQPRAMALETMTLTANRIAEHAARHRLKHINISLHGGEPMTVGIDRLAAYVQELRSVVGRECEIDIGMQTNGTLFGADALAWAVEQRIGVGISLDGPPSVNDGRRPFHDGRPSTSRVEAALNLLQGTPVFNGILSVIDIQSDPVQTLRFLGKWRPPTMDFLLPHGHWVNPPPGLDLSNAQDAIYGRWLSLAFDEWWNGPLSSIAIRTFEDIILRLAGRTGHGETLGTEPVTLLTIATDGAYEGVDTLKSAYAGAQVLDLHVRTHSLDDVLLHKMVRQRQAGTAALSPVCVSCRIVKECGGGYLPHRYGSDGTFQHQSVYCADLMHLIDHARDVVRRTLKSLP